MGATARMLDQTEAENDDQAAEDIFEFGADLPGLAWAIAMAVDDGDLEFEFEDEIAAIEELHRSEWAPQGIVIIGK